MKNDVSKQARLGEKIHIQTLRLNQSLYDKLRKKIAKSDKSINKAVNEAIELYLKRSEV